MNNKQTAVEWLVEQMKLDELFNADYFINQAKEMFEQQIYDAWNNGLSNWDNTDDCNAKQYYTETFNN